MHIFAATATETTANWNTGQIEAEENETKAKQLTTILSRCPTLVGKKKKQTNKKYT